jgi:hypothetical protein
MYTPWWQRLSKPTLEERFELRKFKLGGPVKRYGFKYGGSWADWKTNYEDQMTFEQYLQDNDIVKKPHFLDKKAKGGKVKPQRRLKAAAFLLAPALLPYAATFLGAVGVTAAWNSPTGLALQRKIQNYFEDKPEEVPKFKEYLKTQGVPIDKELTNWSQSFADADDQTFKTVTETPAGTWIGPDAGQIEKEKEKIKERLKPGETKPIDQGAITTGSPPPEIKKWEPPVSGGKIDIPLTTGGSEIPETKLEDLIFTMSKSGKEYRDQTKENMDSETVTEIEEIVKDYREKKTKPDKTQPTMKSYEKQELITMVLEKYKENEGVYPTGSQLKVLIPQMSDLSKQIQDMKVELPGASANYDRMDPTYIKTMESNAQTRANEGNTISIFGKKNFYPKEITLADGSVVDGEKFFIDNLVKRTEMGPNRKDTQAVTLTDKKLAELFNTNIRKIEKATKNLREDANFTADYPPKRDPNYARLQTEKIIKEAREYLKPSELKNVIDQENQIWELNTAFKNGTLKITDYPNLVIAINTTLDKETGILDHSIKKTNKEMTERAMKPTGLFNVSHTVPKTSKQKNIEYLRYRNLSDYKTNQGLFKSMDAYVKNQIDKPDYEERLADFDRYMKKMGLRVKIGNRFFGLDEKMFDSNTGEHTGMNRTLKYYGLPEFKNGVPLKKQKMAEGGLSGVDQYLMNRYR